jgi:hypothetical protein
MNVNKPAISSVHALRAPGASLGSQVQRYGPDGAQGQAGGQGGYINGARGQTFVAGRSAASINTPQTGGVGSQSRPPRGVSGGIPGGGFGGGIGGGAPQVGGGDFAKSAGGAGGTGAPQKTTGTQTNPYGKTTPPGESPKDALTKALLQKILNDRKEGEQAVKRDPETKKISEVDREKVKLDEQAKAEVAKLTETFKKDSIELEKSINDFRKTFEKQLKETDDREKADGTPEDKQLNNILEDLVKYKEEDSNGNKAGSAKYNPQEFMDAAERLDDWIGNDKNATEAKDKGYFEDLSKINNQAQKMKATAQEEIALHENKPDTVLRASDRSAANAADEAGRLKEGLEASKADLNTEDQAKVDKFNQQLDKSMKSLNPEEGESFDVKGSKESLAELKKSFNDLPESVRNNPEIQRSFDEVSDMGRVAVEGQELARKMEPDSAKYEQAATEYVQGADRLDAVWAEHRTPEEREADIRTSINDDAFVDKVIAEEKESSSSSNDDSNIQPQTGSQEAQNQENLEIGFGDDAAEGIGEDQFDSIDSVGTRGLDESLDLEKDNDIVDDILNQVEDDVEVAEAEDIEIDIEDDVSDDIDEILDI